KVHSVPWSAPLQIVLPARQTLIVSSGSTQLGAYLFHGRDRPDLTSECLFVLLRDALPCRGVTNPCRRHARIPGEPTTPPVRLACAPLAWNKHGRACQLSRIESAA